MGLDDPVIEIAVTPNRPDCLGVAGVARDLAAAEIGDLVVTEPKPVKGAFPCPVKVKLDLADDPKLAPAFALRLVRGVKNGPSPEWLQKKLRAIGLRPINALVDVTNLLTIDRARPLHDRIWERGPCALVGGPADLLPLEREAEPEAPLDRVQHRERRVGDLGPDAVAWQNQNVHVSPPEHRFLLFGPVCRQPVCATVSPRSAGAGDRIGREGRGR